MTRPFRRLDDQTLVYGQISLADIATARAAGVTILINNRPDDEEPGQISGATLEVTALASGMTYVAAPSHGMPDTGVVDAVSRALAARGPGEQALMFCKSGMRSTVAWALAQNQAGVDAIQLREAASNAGYDLSRLPLQPIV